MVRITPSKAKKNPAKKAGTKKALATPNPQQRRRQARDADLDQPVLLLHEDLVDGFEVGLDQLAQQARQFRHFVQVLLLEHRRDHADGVLPLVER